MDEGTISYYALNLKLPDDKTGVLDILGEPSEVRSDTLVYPDFELSFGKRDELYKIKLISSKYDLLGRGIYIGDKIQRFHYIYNIESDGAAKSTGAYGPSSNRGVYIRCGTKEDIITSIEVFTTLLK